MFSGSAQTLGTGWHEAGGHHGHKEEGGGRCLWRQTCWRGWQSRLQVCSVHVVDQHMTFACELRQQVIHYRYFCLCFIELSKNLQNT